MQAFLERLKENEVLSESQFEQVQKWSEEYSEPEGLARRLVEEGWLTRWQAGQLVLGRGLRLGKYKLVDVLSRSDAGSVFLAEHAAMHRRVALNILAKQLSQDPEWMARFVAEAQTIALMDHPHLVHAYNLEHEAGRYFLVMEYVDGEDLQRRVSRQGPLPLEEAAEFFRQAAEALQYLHEKGFVHGHLKPTKFIITPQGSVKILHRGFGRLAATEPDRPSEQPAASEAKPETKSEAKSDALPDFGAPEIWEGNEPTPQSDLFCFGLSLVYALTGKVPELPRSAGEDAQVNWQKTVESFLATLPVAITPLCRELLAWDQSRRPESAANVATLLAKLCPEEPLKKAARLEDEDAELPPAEDRPAAKRERKASVWSAMFNRAFDLWCHLRVWQRIAAGAAGLVILGLLVATGIWLFSGERGKPSAAAGKTTSEMARAETVGGKRARRQSQTEPSDEEKSPFPHIPADPTFDPTKFDVSPPAPAPTGSESQPSGRAAVTPASPPAEAASDQTKVEPASDQPRMEAAEDVAESSPEDPDKADTPTTPPQEVEAEKSPPQSGESGLENSTESAPPAAPTGQAQVQPEAQPAGASGTESSASAREPQLFEGFPEAIDLPEFLPAKEEEPTPVEIGRVGATKDDWQLILLGGGTAFRKGNTFVLTEVPGPDGSPYWPVVLESQPVAGKAEKEQVGRFFREGPRLYFQWAKEAPSPAANYLRNCLLQVRAGGQSRYVQLRTTVRGEGPVLDLDRGASTVSLSAKYLPQEEFLRWELVSIDGNEGFKVQPALPAPPKGTFTLHITRKDQHNNTHEAVRLRALFSSTVKTHTVRLQLIDRAPFAGYQEAGQKLVIRRNSLEQQRNALEKKLNPKDPQAAPRGDERTLLVREIDELEARLWVIDFYLRANKKARIHYRIFLETSGQKIVLVET